MSTSKKKIIIVGLSVATISGFILFSAGDILIIVIGGVALLGFGFILAHSTLITIATELTPKSRAIATSLVATCFVSGGGIGTAIGLKLIEEVGFDIFFLYYGIALILLVIATAVLIKSKYKNDKAISSGEFNSKIKV